MGSLGAAFLKAFCPLGFPAGIVFVPRAQQRQKAPWFPCLLSINREPKGLLLSKLYKNYHELYQECAFAQRLGVAAQMLLHWQSPQISSRRPFAMIFSCTSEVNSPKRSC